MDMRNKELDMSQGVGEGGVEGPPDCFLTILRSFSYLIPSRLSRMLLTKAYRLYSISTDSF
jgi:hypothetical protein